MKGQPNKCRSPGTSCCQGNDGPLAVDKNTRCSTVETRACYLPPHSEHSAHINRACLPYIQPYFTTKNSPESLTLWHPSLSVLASQRSILIIITDSQKPGPGALLSQSSGRPRYLAWQFIQVAFYWNSLNYMNHQMITEKEGFVLRQIGTCGSWIWFFHPHLGEMMVCWLQGQFLFRLE